MSDGHKKTSTLRRGGGDKASSSVLGTHRGLKALKKESHDKLGAYQHLFYLLQTEPVYLARLMFAMPQVAPASAPLIPPTVPDHQVPGVRHPDPVQLWWERQGRVSTAQPLQDGVTGGGGIPPTSAALAPARVPQVSTRVERIQDIVSGNPLVVKLVVSYNRWLLLTCS